MSQTQNDEIDRQDIQERVNSLSWYHTIDLGNGIETPGAYDHRTFLPFYGLPKDLSGVEALDIGGASGFFTFEMERRGAEVTSTELPTWLAHDFGPDYRPDDAPQQSESYLNDPFLFARQVLGSNAKRFHSSIYDLGPDNVGLFDLVFCGSVLLHLTDPIRALWSIRSVTRQAAILTTAIDPSLGRKPLAVYAGERGGYVWWIPNRAGFESWVESAGFKGWEWYSDFSLDYADGQTGPYHGVIHAWVTDTKPPILDRCDTPSQSLIARYGHRSIPGVSTLQDLLSRFRP